MKLSNLIPFKDYDTQDEWGENHRKYVQRLNNHLAAGDDPADWQKDFDILLSQFDAHPVASIKQGAFTNNDRQQIAKIWNSELKGLFQTLAKSPHEYHWEIYDKIDDLIKSVTTRHRRSATARMIVAAQPLIFSTVVTQKHLQNILKALKAHHIDDLDYAGFTGSPLELNSQLQQFLLKAYPDHTAMEMATVAWRIPEILSDIDKKMNILPNLLSIKKNIILQGAPGTGKTFMTARLALQMTGNDDVDINDHKAVMERYHQLIAQERIGFVTFHMSMDYEDFVEGLKPIPEDNNIRYDVIPGIFRRLVSRASAKATSNFDAVYDSFMADIEECDEKAPYEVFTANGHSFAVCPNSNGNLKLLTGAEKKYNGVLTRELLEDTLFGDGPKYWQSYYRGVINLLKDKYQLTQQSINDNNNHILIIDEINRGNVSKIFGELITLLESDKRSGGTHPLSVTLPYSKETLMVPDNLYIIGTMNTTDRSIGSIDYALRRRFAFVTIKSSREIIENHYKQKHDTAMRDKALSRYDQVRKFLEQSASEMDIEDLMVGHSYFMADSPQELDLKWDYEVLPLLDEYYKDGIINQRWTNK